MRETVIQEKKKQLLVTRQHIQRLIIYKMHSDEAKFIDETAGTEYNMCI